MKKSPIFIMSSERSGSNLLRVLIGNHHDIASPVSPQLLTGFGPSSRYFAPLSNKNNAEKLFNEILSIVNHEYHDWKLNVNFDTFYNSTDISSFFDFFDFFYSAQSAKEKGKQRFVCKENAIFDYAFPLLSFYKDAKFIYLYRDPRDYVSSWKNVPLGYDSAQQAINVWISEQKKCDQLINSFGLPHFKVKYEDLIENTPKIMTEVLRFVDEPIDENCFLTDPEKNKSYSWNSYWKNLEKPVMKDNKGKFLKELDEETIRFIEFSSKEFMLKLGYSAEFNYELMQKNKSKLNNLFNFKKKSFKGKNTHDPKTITLLKERQDLTKIIMKNAQNYFYSNIIN